MLLPTPRFLVFTELYSEHLQLSAYFSAISHLFALFPNNYNNIRFQFKCESFPCNAFCTVIHWACVDVSQVVRPITQFTTGKFTLNAAFDMATRVFEFPSVIRGYHVYRFIWLHPHVGEQLHVGRDTSPIADHGDPTCMALQKDGITVGHVPREYSSIFYHFAARGGNIDCTVTGPRQRSSLQRGGLEIPCRYTFCSNDRKIMRKLRRLLL